MKSHQYDHTVADFLIPSLAPWLGVALLAVFVRLAIPALPAPQAHLDLDRTVISNQIQSSKSLQAADLILIGDSSCLMNVDALQLEKETGLKTRNFGMLSFLDMPTFGLTAKNHAESSSSPARKALVIVHPEFLRRASPSRAHIEYARSVQLDEDYFYSVKAPWKSVDYLSGAWIVRNRFIGRLPNPLSGPFREYFGFTTSMTAYMDEHHGSAVDPGKLTAEDLKGNVEYRISDYQRMGAERFREMCGDDVEIWIGISPIPQSLVESSYSEKLSALQDEWSALLGADHVLPLPAALADENFANKTHLTPAAVSGYTEKLGEIIRARMTSL